MAHSPHVNPLSGSFILLATPKGRIADGFWSPVYGVWSWPYVMVEPTHWMPLPELPGAQTQPAPSVPREAIEKMLTQLMDIAVSNGANSISMPDEQIQDLLRVGNPSAEECRLIRMGWDAAMRTKSAPEGWKLVPVDPTLSMLTAAILSSHAINVHRAEHCYRAMIAAAPEAKP